MAFEVSNQFKAVLILLMSFVVLQVMKNGPRLQFSCSVLNIYCPKFDDIILSNSSTYDKKYESVINNFKMN